jgi:hypothetical protein
VPRAHEGLFRKERQEQASVPTRSFGGGGIE